MRPNNGQVDWVGPSFFRGVFYAALFSIPLWVFILWVGCKVVR